MHFIKAYFRFKSLYVYIYFLFFVYKVARNKTRVMKLEVH
jgi:hypothetical protein